MSDSASSGRLREALHTLAAVGLVDLQHGRGVFITAGSTRATAERLTLALPVNDSAQCLRDLFEIRRVLEGAAAEWAAERAKVHDREHERPSYKS